MKFIRLFFVCVVASLAILGFSALPVSPSSARAEELDPAALEVIRSCSDLVSSSDFSAELSGKIEARVFGFPYTQKLYGSRFSSGGRYEERAESASTFVKAAMKKIVEGDKCYVATGKFKRGSVRYGEPTELSRADFTAAYGLPGPNLFPYVIDGAVTSCRCVGEGVYEYSLDPSVAAEYSRNAVKTALKSKSYPDYSEVTVVLYVADGRPIKTETRERFRINKFGGADCVATYTEVFAF